MKIRKNDTVKIEVGKDQGKTGKILRVLNGKVWVENLNLSKRHVKKMSGHEGGIIEIAKPINISNVALVCPNCKKTTRVGFKMENGEKLRICKKCKEVIQNVETKK